MNISKSKYTKYCQCEKLLWLDKNKPEEATVDEDVLRRFKAGTEAGNLAKEYFGKDNFVDLALLCDADGKPLYDKMIAATRAEIKKGTENICEAAFSADGCYCAVDILHRVKGGYEIYEVKSGTELKETYVIDAAYQKWVLEKCGVRVVGVNVMLINGGYVRHGEIDVNELFRPIPIDNQLIPYYEDMDERVRAAKSVLAQKEEPQRDIGCQCKSPYACAYMNYCFRQHGIPEISVFDLCGIHFSKACEMYAEGVVTLEQAEASGKKFNDTQKRQIDFALNDRGIYVDKEGIKGFLDGLTYPLYFLDFETFSTVVPLYDGVWPNRQIPFQYSLHYLKERGGEVLHEEFLAEEGADPRRAIAESLVKNIPDNACVLAYFKSFECGRLAELAGEFPDLKEHLLAIRDNVCDLYEVFRKGYVYNRAMGGSFSIKSVLPALFPDDPELNYHNLDNVHNGTEASATFLDLAERPAEEREALRNSLLKYCELDTYAMVKILRRLEELCP